MQKRLTYGVQSVPNMELEEFRLSSSLAKFKLSNFLIINYFLYGLGFGIAQIFVSVYHWPKIE
jgi:hypothetical protein